MFQVGDNAIHMSHGVGKIVSIETRHFHGGKEQSFYILEIYDNGAPKKVFVPVENTTGRLRKPVTRSEGERILFVIKQSENTFIDHGTWNRRYRDFMENIHSGNLERIAQTYGALKSLKKNKDLSFGELKLLDCAKDLLVKELTLVGIDLE